MKMIFDKLKDSKLSKHLTELIGGWLISGDSKDEKLEQFSDLFDEVFDYRTHPSREAERSYRAFARKTGITPRPAKAALRRRLALRVAAVLIPAAVLIGGVLLAERAADGAGDVRSAIVTVSVPADDFDPSAGLSGQEQDSNTVVRVAENSVVTLPDKSTVMLSKGSEIRHSETFDGGRTVELYGQARFNVTKAADENDNFTVHTEHLKIAVLGTEFTVHSPADETHSTIDLLHGSVEVEASGRRYLMTPAQHLRLDHATGEVSITRISPRTLVYNEMPGMVFSETPISQVLAKLESDFGVAVRIVGTMPAQEYDVNGDMVNAGSPDQLLRTLQRLSGDLFTYEITDQEVIITINNI